MSNNPRNSKQTLNWRKNKTQGKHIRISAQVGFLDMVSKSRENKN